MIEQFGWDVETVENQPFDLLFEMLGEREAPTEEYGGTILDFLRGKRGDLVGG